MIKHIVIWTLKETAEGKSAAENATAIKNMLEALPKDIAQIVKIEVSADIVAADPKADLVLYSEFRSQGDLETYQKHPKHQECVAFVVKVASGRKVIDYEI